MTPSVISQSRRRCLSQGPGLRLAMVDYPPGWSMPAHEHESLGLSVVLRGQVEECVGRATVQNGIGGLVVKPAGTSHANRFGPMGARLLSLDLHPMAAGDVLGSLRTLGHWRWLRSTGALRVAAQALRRAAQEAEAGGGVAEAAALDLGELLEGDRLSPDRRPSPWLLMVRERIHAEHASACRVRELARAAGVHPVYLARRFRAQFGCSVTAYLRQVRVYAAATALADGDRPVGGVAGDTGFADQSHLCRVFRAAVGVAPSEYRSLARTG